MESADLSSSRTSEAVTEIRAGLSKRTESAHIRGMPRHVPVWQTASKTPHRKACRALPRRFRIRFVRINIGSFNRVTAY